MARPSSANVSEVFCARCRADWSGSGHHGGRAMCDTHPVTVHKILGRSERVSSSPRTGGTSGQSTTWYLTSRRPQLAGVKESGSGAVNVRGGDKFAICPGRWRDKSKGPRHTHLSARGAAPTAQCQRCVPTDRLLSRSPTDESGKTILNGPACRLTDPKACYSSKGRRRRPQQCGANARRVGQGCLFGSKGSGFPERADIVTHSKHAAWVRSAAHAPGPVSSPEPGVEWCSSVFAGCALGWAQCFRWGCPAAG